MNAIYGFTGFEDKNLLKKMANILDYKGEQKEHLVDKNVCMGINLKYSDDHIFCKADKNVFLIFNGSIYNQTEDLPGRILELYREKGNKFLEELHGAFSLALYDIENKK